MTDAEVKVEEHVEKKKEFDHVVKVLFIGGAQSGKSQFLQRLVEQTFSERYDMTIGVDFKHSILKKDNVAVKVQMWDLSGQERFRCMNSLYFKGPNVVFFCADLSKPLDSQLELLRSYEPDIELGARLMVLGLKSDAQVCHNQLQKFCAEQKLPYFATSAKTGFNVQGAIVRSLQVMKLFRPDFELPPKEFGGIAGAKIGFFGSENDLWLARSCFYEVEPQKFLQKVDGQVLEFVEGDQVYVCSGEVDKEVVNKAKCVLMVSAGEQVQVPNDLKVPVFVISQVGDIEKTLKQLYNIVHEK